ncbi:MULTISPECIES: hypothetical protein [Streptomyces]|uniref:Uncharacterized protein n=1 Tax=Streptomyces zinciresistens K42 TaxID=700597 RepID=G2G753_9ACTN|nr:MULTISPECIES: hypothetical protein [Streptomyces]EGX60594.1 hypothetical protein SZN_06576 [Streptomyces zinciresistens K42]MDT9695927.1 hypothetical protein [Streptomyces sp. P17]
MKLPAGLARMMSPLRHIDAKPDDLVLEAHHLLTVHLPKHQGFWEAENALASRATAMILLAGYLREHRDG